MRKFYTLFLLLLVGILGHSQVTNEGLPISWNQQFQEISPLKLAPIDLKKYQDEDAINDSNKTIPWRFGAEIIVDYNLQNAGNWTELENGDRVWRIRLQSKDAKTLNFVMSDFFMPPNATLYLYNHNKTDLIGAYDSQQNNTERVLGTWLVKGDDIYLEYFEPKAVRGQGKLEIFKVIHGYRTASDRFKDPEDGFNESFDCNYDVNCDLEMINALKERSKKAVALIIVGNDSHCTGTLINNTNNDGTPYFLTANHCYSNPSTWAFRFDWISNNPVCSGTQNSTNATTNYTISGASLKARRTNTDFALLQINNPIPSSWGVVYAGWNKSLEPSDFTYGVHHPAGDIMKVAIDLNSPTLVNESRFWYIDSWDYGVTEGGSSGSGLFNSEGQLIGQLQGGYAGCNGTSYNGLYDQYGAIATSWTGNSPTARLSDWLDPSNTGAVSIGQYPVPQLELVDISAKLSSFSALQCTTTVSPNLVVKNEGLQTITSFNYEIKVNSNTISTLVWTGSLATGATVTINLGNITGNVGVNEIRVITSVPNAVADLRPIDNTYYKTFTVAETVLAQSLNLNVLTDGYSEETTWKVEDLEGNIIAQNGNLSNNSTYNIAIPVNHNSCYKFVFLDEYGDGICCAEGNGSFSLTTNLGTVIASGSNFGSKVETFFKIMNSLSVDDMQENMSNLKLYPNPTNGILNIENKEVLDLSYEVYNILGQLILSEKLNNKQVIDLSAHNAGIYMVKMYDFNQNVTQTFKVIKN